MSDSTHHLDAFSAALAEAAAASGLTLDGAELDACRAHYALLVTWNRTHNLTRITAPGDAARKHYLDCLAPLKRILPHPRGFVDVGSGAGFPGLLAALVWPEARAVLVEPAQKRASFLLLAASAMGLAVEIAAPGTHLAGEALDAAGAPARGDMVLSRATFSPGRRGELRSYAGLGATVAVWGHLHDTATWQEEVSMWDDWQTRSIPYTVDGLEERALLLAERRRLG